MGRVKGGDEGLQQMHLRISAARGIEAGTPST